ncbi:hypothetical protein [Parvibaculum sp.]|uniref:hypothetical protein n=1 Tax=Parvibaculum sp. TaxID=2024848 RepID=UPI00273327AE|nr:hypothetical protein [Parvibaculum sp.]MDP3327711.1 hypothetical protein [Parvibaculum sp.]
MPNGHRITVGDLREQLSSYSAEAEITFGCTEAAVPLIFYRVKNRGPRDAKGADHLVQIELNELHEGDLPFR